jgi:predicted Zn-ribbon and HTH transcriptional regulator
MDGQVVTIISIVSVLVVLGFIGFAIYFIFKQLEFVIRAINLYERMITRQDTIIELLKDIREKRSAGNESILNETLSSDLQHIKSKKVDKNPDLLVCIECGFTINKKDLEKGRGLFCPNCEGRLEP